MSCTPRQTKVGFGFSKGVSIGVGFSHGVVVVQGSGLGGGGLFLAGGGRLLGGGGTPPQCVILGAFALQVTVTVSEMVTSGRGAYLQVTVSVGVTVSVQVSNTSDTLDHSAARAADKAWPLSYYF
jgi:hypothetical protein